MQSHSKRIAMAEYIRMPIEDYFGQVAVWLGSVKNFGKESVNLCLPLIGIKQNHMLST